MDAKPTLEQIRRAPKVLLHDHLDGGLRPQTIVERADAAGYTDLPTDDPEELGAWFVAAANSGSLERYLETFRHTVAVMQTREALERVAAECVEDLAADGIVYAEVRYAPEQHLRGGLRLEEVVEAVQAGFAEGVRRVAHRGAVIQVRTLLTAMRQAARSREIAELVVRYRDEGVVGFDLAGPEAGFPPSRHVDACTYLRQQNAYLTIHAGEASGLPSIWEALQWCGADRIGHGVRVVEDIEAADEHLHGARLGRLASYVRDKQIPLEICPSSNVQTGAAPSLEAHPIHLLHRLRFRVTVNTDNRLLGGITLSDEFAALVDTFGYGWDDLESFTVNAMKSAFASFDERLVLVNGRIKPGFAQLKWGGR